MPKESICHSVSLSSNRFGGVVN
ncbi:hypothetical protein DSM3645_03138 [Blastopirellula marina DSM 3645]|uniref:Uncharacterized protein n=1 Tax=Blastopirellula marina DSM 3645 TaxID=314230 RepID=A3ZVU1_9BACT|nr:hypothetical protein DSM3645_03138 [Blastopirellula marina DSM 3645]